jgi:hypothetical protein
MQKPEPKARTAVVIEKNLLSDQSGATMVMGVFMAMVVVGMIYYVWGFGGTIIHRERMQDAADAAAFGASVFAARGMNLIALLNTLMAVFAVIGTACRLLQTFIEATAIADDAACAACIASIVGDITGACVEICEAAVEHDIEWADDGWLGDIADMCDTVNRGIHGAQVGIRTGAMIGAEGYVLTMLPQRYRPTVTEGIFVPGSLSISIQSEDDDTTWACHHGWTGMFVRGPALVLVLAGEFAFFEPPSVGFIAGEAAVGIEEFATSDGSEHYCNNGSLTFQRVPTDSWLGEGVFQNYSAVMGTPPFGWVTNGVAVANWGRTTGTEPNVFGLGLSVVGQLHRLSFADSEYYYEEQDESAVFGDTAGRCTHEEWLWHTRWRARMRRFHAGSSITGMLGSVISGVQSVIVH